MAAAGGRLHEVFMSTKERKVIVVADAAAVAETGAERLLARLSASKDRFAVCLTGGSSPEGLYRLIAKEPLRSRVPWDRVHWFIGDDRFVPVDNPLSNMGMAKRLFLDPAGAPLGTIHPMPTNANDPDSAARGYEQELKTFYGPDRLDPARPLFDFVLMGLGPDGHVASLYPNHPQLDEKERWVVGVPNAGFEPFVPRVTLTFPALASSREMLFQVDGGGKRGTLRRIFTGSDLPGSRVYSNGELVWLLDRAAAPEGVS
jgi:6-phosphogluconolactonase